jgi:type VI protein secretion system component VasF
MWNEMHPIIAKLEGLKDVNPAIIKDLRHDLEKYREKAHQLEHRLTRADAESEVMRRNGNKEVELSRELVKIEKDRRENRGIIIFWLIALNAVSLMWTIYLLVNFVYERKGQ